MTINTVTIEGNLADQPRLQYTAHQGIPVAEAVILVNRRIKGADDEYEDAEPTRYRVKAWRQLAENIATLTKGTRVLATGRVETEAYADKQTGEKRTADVVHLDALGASLAYATVEVTKNPKGDA